MSAPPRTWLLIGDKLGDNAQVQVAGGRAGLALRGAPGVPQARMGAGQADASCRGWIISIRPARRRLEPPWPDLILTVGRRPSMAALWVQDQSGGRTRIVLVGRPKRWAERFALIIAPSQFKIPPRDNLVQLGAAADACRPAAVAAAGDAWRERLGRPRAAADRRAGRRRDQAVPVRRRGRGRRCWQACAHRRPRRRQPLSVDQPAHAARRRGGAGGRPAAGCAAAPLGAPRPRPTTPISGSWPAPTASWSPATASR